MKLVQQVQIILFVQDQAASTQFYSQLLQCEPDLMVPGMTEFNLTNFCKLGLMPYDGIAKILEDKTPHPSQAHGIPRSELYLRVADLNQAYAQALSIGATPISPIQERDWGDRVCYFTDLDGHVIAFAEKGE